MDPVDAFARHAVGKRRFSLQLATRVRSDSWASHVQKSYVVHVIIEEGNMQRSALPAFPARSTAAEQNQYSATYCIVTESRWTWTDSWQINVRRKKASSATFRERLQNAVLDMLVLSV